jgi:hypothetical protein
MSSDPTRPNPEWWQQQDPQRNQGQQDAPDYQDPPAPGYQAPGSGYQGNQGNQGSQETQRFPVNQGHQAPQGNQGYQAPQGPQGHQGYQGPPPRMRRRRRRWPIITLIVIIVVLVVGDRAANAYTENQMASQFQSSLALSGKPHVVIEGFPFLTQLAARDFRTVNINATDETTGPLEIARLGTGHLHGTGERGRHPAGHHAGRRRP